MSGSNSDFPWYALRVKTNFERIAATILSGKDFPVYVPVWKSRKRWSDRVKEVEQPLFPGYVFCRLNVQNRLPVLTTPHVQGIVGIGKTPVALPDSEIDAVEKIVLSGLGAEPWPYLPAGQRIRISGGPLAGAEGTLIAVRNRFRIVVSINLLQRSIAADIETDMATIIEPRMSQTAAAIEAARLNLEPCEAAAIN